MQPGESRDLFEYELVQLAEEGVDTSDLKQAFKQVSNPPTLEDVLVLEELWHEAAARAPEPDFSFEEPSGLAEIHKLRPKGPRKLAPLPADEVLGDKALGAWLGRVAGCMLGKPVEGASRARIEAYLKHCNAYPLDDYFPASEPDQVPEKARINLNMRDCLRPNITYGAKDDDTDYSVFNMVMFQQHGSSFTTADIGAGWLGLMPYNRVCTAEHIAYRNLVNGVSAPATAQVRNPYREWIGAQIRADFWGWVTPGNLELAAEFAWRDAALSHTKNGIYGEMFIAALIAAAYITNDLREALELALTEIPKHCRLVEAIQDTINWCGQDADWRDTWQKIMDKYGFYHPVHTINNAALVVMGLLHSGGDFGKAISISVMGGLDTDCNGATAGSIMGVFLGGKAIPPKWSAPLNDILQSSVLDHNVNKLSQLAADTVQLMHRA